MTNSQKSHAADVKFASLFSGALGSAAVALLFLVIDSTRGEPFFTPSLMGSVLFLGTSPVEASVVRMDLMAAYTVVHFIAFTVLGAAVTVSYARSESMPRHPLILATILLAVLTVGAVAVDRLFVPGLLATVGGLPLAVANTAAALVMGTFIHRTLEHSVPYDPLALPATPAIPVRVEVPRRSGNRTH